MARRHKASEHPVHFISGYVRHRVPLFQTRPHFAQLFLDALCFYRQKLGLRIYGYVVMPDHYHLLLGFPYGLRISDFLRDFKSYLSRQIVERLTTEKDLGLLRRFQLSRPRKRRRDPTYGILQPDNDDRVIYTEKFFQQKLRYIHNNPVRKALVAAAADYPWSSCRSYLTGVADPIALDAWS
ncbi:MAG: transposase [Terriglobia bacterium]